MMIEPIQTRVDEFDSTGENRKIVHRVHTSAKKTMYKHKNYGNEREQLYLQK